MWNFLRISTTIIVLLCLQLAVGNDNDACNCTCFNQPVSKDVRELIQEVMKKTDLTTSMEVSESKYEKAIIIRKSELDDMIDKRIKVYLEKQPSYFGIAQEGGEHNITEVPETEYSTSSEVEASSFGEIDRNISSINFGSQKLSVPITYTELEKLKATCNGDDNCKLPRDSDNLVEYNCHCGRFCSALDTCCLDSPFRGQPKDGPVQTCREVFRLSYFEDNFAYFMADQCPENSVVSDSWKRLCSDDSDIKNIMSFVPVTSLSTNITYKNYYCFKCHETNEAYYFWKLQLDSKKELGANQNGNPTLVFNDVNNHWMAQSAEEPKPVRVELYVRIPEKTLGILRKCRLHVISSCHDSWLDDITSWKCTEYTAIIALGYPRNSRVYKNPHCALCNLESLEDVHCSYIWGLFDFKIPLGYTKFFKVTPSRKCLDNFIWNPFSNECSPLMCSEGYTLKSSICVPN